MRKFIELKKVLAAAVLFLALAGFLTTAEAADLRVNLVFENGTALVYAGKEAGFQPGQALNVVRGGQTVGTLEVISVTSYYAQAKIITGLGTVAENDVVTPAGGAAPQLQAGTQAGVKIIDTPASTAAADSGKSGSAESAGDSGEKKSSSKKSTGKKSGRSKSGSRSSGKSSSSGEEAAGEESSAAGDESSAAAGSSSKSSKSRKGRSSGSSKSSDEGEKETAGTKEQIEPVVLAKEPHYSLHIGYFFLGNDLPGTVRRMDPAPMVAVDYWKPKKKNMNVYYSVMYTRPNMNTYYSNQNMRYQLRMVEMSAGLMWDGLDDFLGYDTYAGVSAGWRNASSEIYCTVTCDGVMNTIKKSQEGIDYHGIFGVKVSKKSEVKFLYSFDEEYYTLDVGFRY